MAAPSPFLALTDIPRALAEWTALPAATGALLAAAPLGDGHPVLVLPGFLTGDSATASLRRFLRELAYDAHAWGLGRNLGSRAVGAEGERLEARLCAIHRESGRRVSLVGWSLGGIMARLVAHRSPDAVRQVITLGSPFAAAEQPEQLAHFYEAITGTRPDDPAALAQLAEAARPSKVPSTSIYSREDGVVAWESCRSPIPGDTDHIEVHGSHWGLPANPAVLHAVADRLAQPEDAWQPFSREGARRWFYPES
jgi:pimeloyl-ACP methyl ester carboxylesterase